MSKISTSIIIIKKYSLVSVNNLLPDTWVLRPNLEALDISHWLCRTQEVASQFIQLQVQHIHREYNEQADLLFKKGLHNIESTLHFQEYIEGLCVMVGTELFY